MGPLLSESANDEAPTIDKYRKQYLRSAATERDMHLEE